VTAARTAQTCKKMELKNVSLSVAHLDSITTCNTMDLTQYMYSIHVFVLALSEWNSNTWQGENDSSGQEERCRLSISTLYITCNAEAMLSISGLILFYPKLTDTSLHPCKQTDFRLVNTACIPLGINQWLVIQRTSKILWSTMIQVILDHWYWSGCSQRNTITVHCSSNQSDGYARSVFNLHVNLRHIITRKSQHMKACR